MLKRMSTTRFASAEMVLDAYLRSYCVLEACLKDEEKFNSVYGANAEKKEKFKEYIKSEELVKEVTVVHKVLSAVKACLLYTSDAADD